MPINLDDYDAIFEATINDKKISVDGYVLQAALSEAYNGLDRDALWQSDEKQAMQIFTDAVKSSLTCSCTKNGTCDPDKCQLDPKQVFSFGIRVINHLDKLGKD